MAPLVLLLAVLLTPGMVWASTCSIPDPQRLFCEDFEPTGAVITGVMTTPNHVWAIRTGTTPLPTTPGLEGTGNAIRFNLGDTPDLSYDVDTGISFDTANGQSFFVEFTIKYGPTTLWQYASVNSENKTFNITNGSSQDPNRGRILFAPTGDPNDPSNKNPPNPNAGIIGMPRIYFMGDPDSNPPSMGHFFFTPNVATSFRFQPGHTYHHIIKVTSGFKAAGSAHANDTTVGAFRMWIGTDGATPILTHSFDNVGTCGNDGTTGGGLPQGACHWNNVFLGGPQASHPRDVTFDEIRFTRTDISPGGGGGGTLTPSTTVVTAPNVTFPASSLALVQVTGAGGTPTGFVTLTVDGVALPSSQALSGGNTTFNLGSLAVGSHTLVASYAGDGVFQASTGSGTATVSPSGVPGGGVVFDATVQSAFGQSVSTMTTPVLTIPNQASRFLICWVTIRGTAQTVQSVTWDPTGSPVAMTFGNAHNWGTTGPDPGRTEWWGSTVPGPGTAGIRVTLSATASFWRFGCQAFHNVDQVAPVTSEIFHNVISSDPAAYTINVTTTSGDMAVGSSGNSNFTVTAVNGSSDWLNGLDSGWLGSAGNHIQATGSTTPITHQWNNVGSQGLTALTIRQASGGGVPSTPVNFGTAGIYRSR